MGIILINLKLNKIMSTCNKSCLRENFNIRPRVVYDRAFEVVSDATRVYFGSSADDQVRAIDLASGMPVWSFSTEGPVRLAPTIDKGRAYFGSDDGGVYCLDAVTGKEIWRFNAATDHAQRLPGNGRVISKFPIRTGILVQDNLLKN